MIFYQVARSQKQYPLFFVHCLIIMEFTKIKNIIEAAQNITILPSPELEKDAFPASLAFFYSLKKLGKNVNFLCENLPENFKFLINKDIQIPATKPFNHLASNQENFLISIKESTTKLSQIFYQKTENGLNLYLKTDKGELRQEDISFGSVNFSSADSENFLFCLGVKNFSKIEHLFQNKKWTSVINIDNEADGDNEAEIDNEADGDNDGKINLIQLHSRSFSEIVFDILNIVDQKLFEDTDVSNPLLAGMMQDNSHFHNIGHSNGVNHKILQKIGFLMEKGAVWQGTIFGERGLENNGSLRLFQRVLNRLMFSYEKNIIWLILREEDFRESGASPSDLPFSFQRLIFSISPFQNFLCLWENKPNISSARKALNESSPVSIWGVFYSTQKETTEKVENYLLGTRKNNGVLFKVLALSVQEVKDAILNLL